MSSDAEEEEEVERGRCSPKAHFPSRDSLMFVRWYVVINRFLECVWREGVLHLTAGSELLLGRWIETNRWISQRDFYQLQPEKVLVYITTTRLFSPFWSIITPVVSFSTFSTLPWLFFFLTPYIKCAKHGVRGPKLVHWGVHFGPLDRFWKQKCSLHVHDVL